MKATELMIGDWVKCSDPKPFRVEQLDGVEEQVYGDDGFYVDTADLQPIPLTDEILEKNGFKYDEFPKFAVNEITENTKVAFSYHSGSSTVFMGISEPNFNLTSACVLCVHELQQLLRLSRIKKDIEL